MIPIARYLKNHEAGDNSNEYTPVWTDGTYNHNPTGSIGSMTPLWYGVHNYSGDQDIVIWTVDQGLVTGPSSTPLAGVTIHLLQGHTFFAKIAKLTVTDPVVLLGTTNIPGAV